MVRDLKHLDKRHALFLRSPLHGVHTAMVAGMLMITSAAHVQPRKPACTAGQSKRLFAARPSRESATVQHCDGQAQGFHQKNHWEGTRSSFPWGFSMVTVQPNGSATRNSITTAVAILTKAQLISPCGFERERCSC